MKKKKRGKYTFVSTPIEPDTEENALSEPHEAAEEAQDDTPEVIDEKAPDYEAMYKEALDRCTRTLAEFDNFRKRSIKEKAAQYDDGTRATAEKLLPLIDNFDRAMHAGEATHAEDTFYWGIALIARQFAQVLTDLGIAEIPADPGTGFDPNLHNAVAHVTDDAFGPGQIAELLQKGYIHKEKVLRHSIVKVAN